MSISFSATKKIDLDTFIEQIIRTNPALVSARKQSQAMRASLKNTGALPDPMLSYMSGYVSGQDQQIKLNQKIPNPIQTQTERSVAALDVELSDTRVLALQRTLISQAQRLYFNAYSVDMMIKLAKDENRALEQMAQSSLKQYESNRVTQQDPLNMSLMRAEVLIKLEQLQQERLSLFAEASRLCKGDEVAFSFPSKVIARPLNIDLIKLQRLSTNTGNLDIVMAAIEQGKSQLARERVNLFNLFEYEIGLGYMPDTRAYEWMAGLSLPLWGSKNTELGNQQDALVLSSGANVDDVAARIRAEVADLYYKIEAADRILPLFEDEMLPKAKQSRTLARMAYQAGRLDFAQWVLSEQRYLALSAQYFRTLADRLSVEADLVRLVGLWR